MKPTLSRIIAIFFFLVLCFSIYSTPSSAWQINTIYDYQFTTKTTSKIINEQHELTASREDVSSLKIQVLDYIEENHTVTYNLQGILPLYQFLFQEGNGSYLLNQNTLSSTLLMSNAKNNFGFNMSFDYMNVREDDDTIKYYLTSFFIKLDPLFFIESNWDTYRSSLQLWFNVKSSSWEQINFGRSYVFSISIAENGFSIVASFPYIQSVYTGYFPSGVENFFNLFLSPYAYAKGTVSQKLNLKYDDSGQLLLYSSSLFIDLPGKVSLKAENILKLSSYNSKKVNLNTVLSVTIPIMIILVVVIVFHKQIFLSLKKLKVGK